MTYQKEKRTIKESKTPRGLEEILNKEKTKEEINNLILNLYYITKPKKIKQYEKEKPIVIEDYNIGRGNLFWLRGFFDPDNPKFIVKGKFINPEDSINTEAHEEFHWLMHKNNGKQSEYLADVYAKVKTGINDIRYNMHNLRLNLKRYAA